MSPQANCRLHLFILSHLLTIVIKGATSRAPVTLIVVVPYLKTHTHAPEMLLLYTQSNDGSKKQTNLETHAGGHRVQRDALPVPSL